METSDNDYKKEDYGKNFTDNLSRKINEDSRDIDHHSRGRVWVGLLIVAIGSVFLAKQMGMYLPEWLFSWGAILIAIGIFVGAKHGFRSGGWIGVVAIGAVLLIDEVSPELSFHQYLWPIAIISVGLLMIIRPRRKKNDYKWSSFQNKTTGEPTSAGAVDDYIDSVSVFGGNKKNIISKDFKGGDIVIFFGGMELNLSQADINGAVELEITQIFGGTKLILPSNWRIKSEIITIFGGFDDKRKLSTDMPDSQKVLVLKGTCVFGGIDVKSF
jgi:predicted membrane protein